MTHEQLIEEIRRLPPAQRLELLEAISHSLREELQPNKDSQAADPCDLIQAKTQGAERIRAHQGGDVQTKAQGADQSLTTLSQRLRGIVKFNGDPPTDEEVKDAYADYLLEKYS